MNVKKMIIVGIEGNIPSMKAHSVTTVKMADALQSHFSDHDVVLATSGSLKSYKNILRFFPFRNHYGVSKAFKIKFLNVWGRDFFYKSIGICGFREKLRSFLLYNKFETDLVYARSFIITSLCIELGIPVILETHAKDVSNPDFVKIISQVDRPEFIGIITIHEELKRTYILAGYPEDKIFVYHDGFSRSLFDEKKTKVREPDSTFIATYVGGLYPEKGIYDILNLAELALVNKNNIMFNIYGGDKEQVKYFSEIAVRRQITNIKFFGFISNKSVPNILTSSDILLMPYPKMNNYAVMDINTTSPIKLFEYMASGRPILSTKLEVIENILEHGKDAYLACQGDIQDLYEGLCQILYRPDVSKMFAENAKNKSKSYSWEERVKQLSIFFDLEEKFSKITKKGN